jgi:DNA-binding beta-propeller fold protein YncE
VKKIGFFLAGAGLFLLILAIVGLHWPVTPVITASNDLSIARVRVEEAPGRFMRKNRITVLPHEFSGEELPAVSWLWGRYRLVFTRPGCREAVAAVKITPLAKEIIVNWELYQYELALAVDPHAPGEEAGRVELALNGKTVIPGRLQLPYGEYELKVGGAGIKPKTVTFFLDKDTRLHFKTDPAGSLLTQIKTMEVGIQPKGMAFSNDGRYLFVALLGEAAVEVIDGETLEKTGRIVPAEPEFRKGGFVEIGVSPAGDQIVASKMETATVHFIPLSGADRLEMTGHLATGGTWSKVVAFSPAGDYLAVSNWSSEDVSVFSYPEKKLIAKVKIPGIPRGLAFAGGSLFVTNYSTGALHRIDTGNWQLVESIDSPRQGALRHVVAGRDPNILFASDMRRARVYIYNLKAKKIEAEIPVDRNPNTIALSPDGRYLFVSCRGPNAPETYLARSPRSGELHVIDTIARQVVDRRVLGNQPTALAVHPSGRYLAVSNFRDNNIEFYRIDGEGDD